MWGSSIDFAIPSFHCFSSWSGILSWHCHLFLIRFLRRIPLYCSTGWKPQWVLLIYNKHCHLWSLVSDRNKAHVIILSCVPIHQLRPNYFGLKISQSWYTAIRLKNLKYLEFSYLTEKRTILNPYSFEFVPLWGIKSRLADSPWKCKGYHGEDLRVSAVWEDRREVWDRQHGTVWKRQLHYFFCLLMNTLNWE